MRGDFSKLRFEKTKHYTSVLEQQGRVALDADHNEQRAIDEHIRETETIDVIGPFGGPQDDAGFAITASGRTIQIGAGRYYVQGILCENEAQLAYGSQPYLMNPTVSDSDLLSQLISGEIDSIRLYLQVWQRMVTALDDPCLREPALGQADTTARRQTVWRVVAQVTKPSRPSGRPFAPRTARERELLSRASTVISAGRPSLLAAAGSAALAAASTPAPAGVAPAIDCCTEMYQMPAVSAPGKLSAQTTGGSSECSCQPTPAAGYRGLENQLYRIEIHEGGSESSATFKWSRENGSVVVAVTGVSGADVMVDSLGPDANLGFQPGQWVELSDDTFLFGPVPNQPGTLYQIKSIDTGQRILTMTAAVAHVDAKRNARLRRWEQSGLAATSNGVALAAGSWLDLENGIQVQFAPGDFQPGDHWLLPARTATGQIEWPPCGGDGAAFQPPHRTQIYVAPLACIHWDPRKQAVIPEDCRRLFPSLTEISPKTGQPAIHVTKINWSNDDLMTFDQLLANGLTVTLDKEPTGRIDASIFDVTFEVPVVSPIETIAVQRLKLPPIVLRTSMPIDGEVTMQKETITWGIPFRSPEAERSFIQLEALAILDGILSQGISYASFVRARVRLAGTDVFAGDGSSRMFLDGQSLGTPGTRADGVTPRMDLTFPSGASEQASDFTSWFFLAPTLKLTLSVQPAAVVLTPSVPNPPSPVATLTTNYPALFDTQIALSVVPPPNVAVAVSVPAAVTIPKGKASVSFPVGIQNTQSGAAEAFQIVASLKNALGITSTVTATLTLTGFQVIP